MQKNKELAKAIFDEFEARQRERRSFELKWLLNMNFLAGNQYSIITPRGEVEAEEKSYEWECREVFNHLAPIVETRLSKLSRFRPQMSVRASGSSDDDMLAAKLSSKILIGVGAKAQLQSAINQTNKWSEVCGTGFYKIVWDLELGQKVASGDSDTFEGDVKIISVSPFEIYPESAGIEQIENQKSIIHAKAFSSSEIESRWGVKVDGREINVNTLESLSEGGYLGRSMYSKFTDKQLLANAEIVIEKYTLPTKEHKRGRLTIVVGELVLYDGELPYFNISSEQKGYPFIRQVAIPQVGCFWGVSVVERLIPLQRAYNSVKCRKYEFLSRLSMGILRVEDGSVDAENLAEEGLSPGKILVYRQGANAPQFMENSSVPLDFSREEDRLLNEFILISGVSELMRSGHMQSENMSGVALQVISEQDDTRLLLTIDSLKMAVREIAKQALMLYKQYAVTERLLSLCGDGGEVEVLQFSANNITAYDVIYDSESELTQTLSQRRAMVFDLLKSGLLTDENGNIASRMRAKVLELLGFGGWEYSQDISQVHISCAEYENQKGGNISELDDHEIHIAEHTKFYLVRKLRGEENLSLLEHIKQHRQNIQGVSYGGGV